MKDLFIEHAKANIMITMLDESNRKISVQAKTDDYYIANSECVTDYPIDLIRGILDVKGPDYLCDEIFREQQPQYIQKPLQYDLLSYIPKERFTKKRILTSAVVLEPLQLFWHGCSLIVRSLELSLRVIF